MNNNKPILDAESPVPSRPPLARHFVVDPVPSPLARYPKLQRPRGRRWACSLNHEEFDAIQESPALISEIIEARANTFISQQIVDPWNSEYWILKCR